MVMETRLTETFTVKARKKHPFGKEFFQRKKVDNFS
jgi:hypothetical protein